MRPPHSVEYYDHPGPRIKDPSHPRNRRQKIGIQIGPASRVAPIDKLSVVLVIFFAALFLGERLTWSRTLGGMLIMAGALVVAME